MKRTATLSEQALQEQVVKLLSAYARPDICWMAVPNGELRNYRVGVKLKAAGLRAGAADLIFLIDARAHAVELKTEIGTLGTKQLDFKESWERAGGFFHSAFGLDQALGVLQGIGAFRAGLRFIGKQPDCCLGMAGVTQPAREGDVPLPPKGASASRRLSKPSVSYEGDAPGPSTLAVARTARASVNGRGQPSPVSTHSGGRRVRKGSASGCASRSPKSINQ